MLQFNAAKPWYFCFLFFLHVDEKFTSIILSKRMILVLSFNIDLTVLRAFCLIKCKMMTFLLGEENHVSWLFTCNKCLQMKQCWPKHFCFMIILLFQFCWKVKSHLYTALYTIQTVSKQLHINKQGKKTELMMQIASNMRQIQILL